MMSKKVPELRFKGFTDDWEERKLGEVATFLNGRAYKQDELLDSGKYKVLRVGNFYTNDSWYYSNMELDDKYYIDKGDLVYTWSATFGPHIWSGEKVIYHYHIWKVELSKFLDRNFTLQLLEADKERLLSSTNGSTMIHVTKGDMESKIVSIPNIDEQKQIGSFFKQLDDTVALYQRKLDLLREQKKGFLQKMFPKNGAKVPELRFAGFADDWEERKLEKVFDTITDYVANGSFESLRKNVNLSNINGFAYLVRLQDASNNWQGPWLYTDQHGYEFLKKSRLQPDDIIMANVGSVGKFFLVPKLDKPMTLAPNAVLIKSSENDQRFLYQMMLTPEMQYKIFKKTTPGVQSKINKTDFKMIETRLPSLEEQQKIGSFFKQLDDTIALHERKLDLLKEQKKGFLQKMFV
ncbi:restriction endonuclease subunit S [Streptococcus thermophilus]